MNALPTAQQRLEAWWAAATELGGSPYAGIVASANARVDEPRFQPTVPAPTSPSAEEAQTNVLADIGANRPALDSVDRQLLQELSNQTGVLPDRSFRAEPTSWVSADIDDPESDGVPTNYELAVFGRNLDASQDRGDGYTFLEQFLNELAGTPLTRAAARGTTTSVSTTSVATPSLPLNPLTRPAHSAGGTQSLLNRFTGVVAESSQAQSLWWIGIIAAAMLCLLAIAALLILHRKRRNVGGPGASNEAYGELPKRRSPQMYGDTSLNSDLLDVD